MINSSPAAPEIVKYCNLSLRPANSQSTQFNISNPFSKIVCPWKKTTHNFNDINSSIKEASMYKKGATPIWIVDLRIVNNRNENETTAVKISVNPGYWVNTNMPPLTIIASIENIIIVRFNFFFSLIKIASVAFTSFSSSPWA